MLVTSSVFCNGCGTSIAAEDAFCRACGTQQDSTPATFHPMSQAKLAMLFVASVGLYSFAWFYFQWRAWARERTDQSRPFLRALFFPVTSHALFDEINLALDQDGSHLRSARLPARTLAVALMGFVWAAPLLLPAPWFLVWLLGFLPLLPAQAAINRLNPRGGYHYARNSRVRPRLALPVLPGLATILYLGASLTGHLPPADVLAGRMLSDRQDALVRSLADLDEGETIEFFFSGGLWRYAEDGNVVTDRRIVSYFEDDQGFQALDWVEYGQIRSLHVLFGGFFDFTSIVACDGSGETLVLYSSGDWDQDRRMIEAIRERLVPGTLVRQESDSEFACPNEVSV